MGPIDELRRTVTMQGDPPAASRGAGAVRHVPPQDAGDEARARRLALHAAVVDLEEALTSPAGDGVGWLQTVRVSIDDMDATLRAHVRDAESDEGLLAQISEDSPWLGPRVEQVRRAHGELVERSNALTINCRQTADADAIRNEAFQLIARVSRHRHQAADLLYDAYDLDLSAGD